MVLIEVVIIKKNRVARLAKSVELHNSVLKVSSSSPPAVGNLIFLFSRKRIIFIKSILLGPEHNCRDQNRPWSVAFKYSEIESIQSLKRLGVTSYEILEGEVVILILQ